MFFMLGDLSGKEFAQLNAKLTPSDALTWEKLSAIYIASSTDESDPTFDPNNPDFEVIII